MIQYEDDSSIKKGNGIETLSVLKNAAINVSRELGFDSIKGAAIHFSSNIKSILELNRPAAGRAIPEKEGWQKTSWLIIMV